MIGAKLATAASASRQVTYMVSMAFQGWFDSSDLVCGRTLRVECCFPFPVFAI